MRERSRFDWVELIEGILLILLVFRIRAVL